MAKPKSGSGKSGGSKKSTVVPKKDSSKGIRGNVEKSGNKGTNSGGPREKK